MSSVHYHGGPLYGGDELLRALYRDTGALVSFARPSQLSRIAPIAKSIMLDNGAFSFWKSGTAVDWNKYYAWVHMWYSRIDYFIVPDVIEGGAEENDALLAKVPRFMIDKAVPVWHSDEPLTRFVRLCREYNTVAIGCCGPHRSIRSKAWYARMKDAFSCIYVSRNIDVRIHGLRMLDGRALSKFPFASADSANVAINTPKTRLKYPEITDPLARVAILRAAIEKVHPPSIEKYKSML